MSHASVGIVGKIEFAIRLDLGMYNHQNGEKSGFGQSVAMSACLSVCLDVAFLANSHGRTG